MGLSAPQWEPPLESTGLSATLWEPPLESIAGFRICIIQPQSIEKQMNFENVCVCGGGGLSATQWKPPLDPTRLSATLCDPPLEFMIVLILVWV